MSANNEELSDKIKALLARTILYLKTKMTVDLVDNSDFINKLCDCIIKRKKEKDPEWYDLLKALPTPLKTFAKEREEQYALCELAERKDFEYSIFIPCEFEYNGCVELLLAVAVQIHAWSKGCSYSYYKNPDIELIHVILRTIFFNDFDLLGGWYIENRE